jgi:hypothetical protein
VANKVLKDKGMVSKSDRDPGAPPKKSKADAAAEKVARELHAKVAAEAMGEIAAAAEQGIGAAGWEHILDRLLDMAFSAQVKVAARRGVDLDKLLKKKLTAAQAQGLMAELLLQDAADVYSEGVGDGDFKEVCKAFGVDLKAIEKRLAAAVVAPAEKPAKKGKRS